MEDVAASLMMSKGSDDCKDLPPGFRFHPTDEEIINCYLAEKIMNRNFTARAIGEADLNKCEPWDLPKKAKMGEKEWYFFCQRDRKYPTGMRTNRATEAGYWKATGKDKEIYNKGKGGYLVGMKKTLVFYRGRAPKGEKTNWVMHEYRLEGKINSYFHLPNIKTAKDEWVVCRIFHKSTGIKRSPISSLLRMNSSFSDDLMDSPPSLPSLLDHHYFNTNYKPANSSFMDGASELKGTILDESSTVRLTAPDGSHHNHHQNFLLSNNYTNSNYQLGIINPSNNTPDHPNSNYYPQIPHSNPFFTFQGSSNSSAYFLNQLDRNNSVVPTFPASSGLSGNDQALLRALADTHDHSTYGLNRQCKAEQFSSNNNQSVDISVSQDTGLSTDRNTEISSVAVSKHDMGGNKSNEDLQEGPSSACPVVDLDCLWNY